jgi:hypothetical protein
MRNPGIKETRNLREYILISWIPSFAGEKSYEGDFSTGERHFLDSLEIPSGYQGVDT